MSRQILGYGTLLALMLLAPAVVYPVLVMKILCFALFACAFNLLIGYTGLLSFGHAVFLGTAGYVAGHSIKVWGFPPELGLIAATLAAAALGWVIGSLAIRRSGIYFAMITLALAQMMYFFFLQAPFTGGEDGLQDVPRGKLLGIIDLADDFNLYYFVLAIFIFAFWLIHRTIHSPFGQVLKAIRENEARAISLGYDVAKYKLLAFVLSAGLAGLAGATKTLVFRFATLTDAHWHTSAWARCSARWSAPPPSSPSRTNWPTRSAPLSPSSWARSSSFVCWLSAAASLANWRRFTSGSPETAKR